jgi:AraC-like DNA-binding protein
MIDAISKYAHLIDPLTKVRHRQLPGYSVWDLWPLLPGDPEHPFYQFAIELKLASSCAVAQDLYGTQLRPHKVRLRYGAPPQAALYAAHLGCPIEFGQEVNQIIFSTSGQAPPLLCNPDPITHAMALECCEREARQLLPAASYTNMLATLLRDRPDAAHNIEQAAACLALHPRTLRRRLKTEGTSFSNIVYEHRLTMACDYLSRDQLNIEEIAARLGYSDAANFSKAFSTWTGLPPGRYRSAHQAANRSASKSD